MVVCEDLRMRRNVHDGRGPPSGADSRRPGAEVVCVGDRDTARVVRWWARHRRLLRADARVERGHHRVRVDCAGEGEVKLATIAISGHKVGKCAYSSRGSRRCCVADRRRIVMDKDRGQSASVSNRRAAPQTGVRRCFTAEEQALTRRDAGWCFPSQDRGTSRAQ